MSSVAAHHYRLATPALLVAGLGVAISQTIVVAALPVFGSQLQVSITSATWLLTIFMLASAVATPIAGRLGDQHGHRRVMIIALVMLAAGSILTAASDQAGWFAGLLIGRALQGFSGGVFPVAFGLARLTAAPTRLPGLVAALSALFGVSGALGMVVAGPLVDLAGTPWLFWVSVIFAGLALAGMPFLPNDKPHTAGRHRLDLVGACLLAVNLVGLLLGISQGRTWRWTSAATLASFTAAVVFGILFVIVERRAVAPMVDLRLLIRPTLAGTNVATLVISVAMFAAVTLVPQFAETPSQAGFGFGYTPAQTGLLLVPTAVLMVLAAPAATRLSVRSSGRLTFQVGSVLACLALLVFAWAHTDSWEFYLGGTILGIAYGLAFASLGGLVVGAVDHSQTGAATGVNTILRTIGGAFGAQLAAVVLINSADGGSGAPTVDGYATAFLIAAGVALLALIASTAIRSPPGPRAFSRVPLAEQTHSSANV